MRWIGRLYKNDYISRMVWYKWIVGWQETTVNNVMDTNLHTSRGHYWRFLDSGYFYP